MKRILGFLLLVSLLLTGCFGKKEAEVIQGEVALAPHETKVLSAYELTNLSDEELVLQTREQGEDLVLLKGANGLQGASNLKLVSKGNAVLYENREVIQGLKVEGLGTVAVGQEVSFKKQEGNISFANTYSATYETNSYFNLLETNTGYEVVAGIFDVDALYSKAALYIDDKLVAISEVPVANGSRALLKYSFNSNEPPHKAQVVFANNSGGEVKFLATKSYDLNTVNKNVIMKNATTGTFQFPQQLVKDSTGITYSPSIELATWKSYTSDDQIQVGGVVYYTAQSMKDTWAVYANDQLVYQGPVTRNGNSMNMHYGNINLPAGAHSIQVAFASDVNGATKYAISKAININVAQGTAKPASLKVNVAQAAFSTVFTPNITVNGVTKAVPFGTSVVFDGLVAGNSYSANAASHTAGSTVYTGSADKASVVVSDTVVEEVTITYSEKTVETGVVSVTLQNPAFAKTIFAPEVKVNGVVEAINWGETKKLSFVAGEQVTVTATDYNNTTHQYTATVNPSSVVVDKALEKSVSISYTEAGITLPSARLWEPQYVYNKGDLAYYNGNIYECLGWAQGKTPDTAAEWKLVGPGVEDKGYIWNGTTARPAELDKKKIVMYYPEWGIYGGHNQYYPHLMPFEKFTHVFYAFATIKNGEIAHFDVDAAINQSMGGYTDWGGKDSGTLGQLRLLQKQYPQVSFLVSVGGWSQSANFPLIADTAAERKKFADSCVAYIRKWKFDGVDIDWEFPGVPRDPDIKDNPNDQGNPYAKPEDKQNFTLLLKDLRAALDKAGEEDGRYYQLATAVNASAGKVQFTEPALYAQYVDFINLMTYDLHGAWDPITGHHSALRPNPKDPHTGLTVEECMDNFLGLGIPNSKLVIGSPFYSRGWKEVKNDGPYPDTYPGLFASANGGAKGVWDGGVAAGNNPYYHLLEMERDPRFTKYRDPFNNSPYLYSAELGEFYTYEDKISLQDKVDFVNQNQYGGIIVWEITGDSPARGGTELLDVIYNGFKGDLATMDFNLQ